MNATICNQFVTNATSATWEETDDGFLRTTARILKKCVMPYLATELGCEPVAGNEVIQMAVDMDTLSDEAALRTLEGCPIVTWEHNWLTPETIGTHGKGSAAGSPRIDGDYLLVDLLVTHPDAIADIKDRKIGEISAAYHSNVDAVTGELDGVGYDVKQVGLKYNHIAIIPYGTGRAGVDVKILNKDKAAQTENNEEGGTKMDVKVRLRNSKKIINTDEEGAAAIAEEEAVATEASTESAKTLEACMAECEALTQQCAECNAALEECKGELSVYKEQLDALLSTEAIEHAAEGMIEEQGEAEEILENMAGHVAKPEEQEKIKNARFCNGKPLRGEALHRAVLTQCGVNVENMSAPAVAGAFKAQNQIVKARGTQRVVSGAKLVNTMQNSADPITRSAHQRLGIPGA